MIHQEYHTCDKCGKRLREGYTGYSTITVCSPYSMSPQELEAVRAGEIKQKENDVDGSVSISFKVGVFSHRDEYELCSSCAKKISKVVKQFMKEVD